MFLRCSEMSILPSRKKKNAPHPHTHEEQGSHTSLPPHAGSGAPVCARSLSGRSVPLRTELQICGRATCQTPSTAHQARRTGVLRGGPPAKPQQGPALLLLRLVHLHKGMAVFPRVSAIKQQDLPVHSENVRDKICFS